MCCGNYSSVSPESDSGETCSPSPLQHDKGCMRYDVVGEIKLCVRKILSFAAAREKQRPECCAQIMGVLYGRGVRPEGRIFGKTVTRTCSIRAYTRSSGVCTPSKISRKKGARARPSIVGPVVKYHVHGSHDVCVCTEFFIRYFSHSFLCFARRRRYIIYDV